jgi:hypothetical protein
VSTLPNFPLRVSTTRDVSERVKTYDVSDR